MTGRHFFLIIQRIPFSHKKAFLVDWLEDSLLVSNNILLSGQTDGQMHMDGVVANHQIETFHYKTCDGCFDCL